MQKGFGASWRRLGPVEKAFLASVALYVILYLFSTRFLLQAMVGLAAFLLGLSALIRLARRALRNAIWRLRNRLIAADTRLTAPPPAWKRAQGLIAKARKGGDGTRLFAWAHVPQGEEEVTILAPITHEVLANLLPGIGDVDVVPLQGVPLMDPRGQVRIPLRKSALDFQIRGYFPFSVSTWDSPDVQENVVLVVDSRVSAVLGPVFPKVDLAAPVL